jgi:hypothetical protein
MRGVTAQNKQRITCMCQAAHDDGARLHHRAHATPHTRAHCPSYSRGATVEQSSGGGVGSGDSAEHTHLQCLRWLIRCPTRSRRRSGANTRMTRVHALAGTVRARRDGRGLRGWGKLAAAVATTPELRPAVAHGSASACSNARARAHMQASASFARSSRATPGPTAARTWAAATEKLHPRRGRNDLRRTTPNNRRSSVRELLRAHFSLTACVTWQPQSARTLAGLATSAARPPPTSQKTAHAAMRGIPATTPANAGRQHYHT